MGVNHNREPRLVQLMRRATAAQEHGDLDQATADYRVLIESYPGFPDAWHYYGILLHQRGEHDHALEMLRRAEKLDPSNLAFLLNLAAVLREQRRLNESLETLQRAHQIDPGHGQVLTQLIQLYLLVRRGGDLITEVEQRITREPENWRLWMLLGECCEQGGERGRAFDAFIQAGKLAPSGEVDPHLRRGWSARASGNPPLAEEAFRSAIKLNPECAQAYVGLATTASEHGRFHRSSCLAQKAIDIDKQCYSAWRLLAETEGKWRDDDFVKTLDQMASTCADHERQAWLLHFARGRIWERRGDYNLAFEAYARGNAIRSRARPYSAVDQTAHMRDIIDNLGPAFIARSQQVAASGTHAIFICGMPRSGTTLVETILASHAHVRAGGEMRYIHDELSRRMRHCTQQTLGTWLAESSDGTLRSVASGWAQELSKATDSRAWITDKMPGNFSLLGLIHACLRGAKIIHVRRDPRDTCLSCFTTAFSEGHEFSFELPAAAHYYNLYQEVMAHWRRTLPPGRIIEVQYESLVTDPEPEIRRLLAALDLAWDPNCLDFHNTRRVVATASLFQVRRPFYKSSIGRWQHFEQHLGPLLQALAD